MIYRNHSQPINSRRRLDEQGRFRVEPSRLVFPGKQWEEDYIGKKQFTLKHHDEVVLASPQSHRFIRKDNLDVADIQGAQSKLKIESINNVLKCKTRTISRSQNRNFRMKTEVQDSLDALVRSKTDQSPTLNKINKPRLYSQSSEVRSQLQKHLQLRNSELTKQNILGIYSRREESNANESKKPLYFSPTYLTSLKGGLN